MYKNVAGQKLRVFAFSSTSGLPLTGDADNITCRLSKDSAAAVDLTDLNPVETEDGFYLFDVAQEETNADTLDFYPESSTPDIVVIVPYYDRYTITNPYLIYGSYGVGLASILLMARAILGDMGPTYTYSDERMQQVIIPAAFYVNRQATFQDSYVVNINNGSITPDPVGDNDFIALCAYKAACLISTYELKNSSGIIMKDGPSMIDTKGTSQNMKAGMTSICATFDAMMLDYLVNGGLSGTGGVGAAILGPYSPGSDYAHGNPSNRGTGWQ